MRRALQLGKRDKIRFTIRPGGEVVLSRAEHAEEDDPVLGSFLGFLARDIASHPVYSIGRTDAFVKCSAPSQPAATANLRRMVQQ